MSSLSIFVFDNADNFIIRRELTSSELAAKSATFSLPKSLASTPCSFYAVANYDASSAKTRAALTALVEKSAADYNGTTNLANGISSLYPMVSRPPQLLDHHFIDGH